MSLKGSATAGMCCTYRVMLLSHSSPLDEMYVVRFNESSIAISQLSCILAVRKTPRLLKMGLPTFARRLSSLPVELVHQVLDDLTYIKVLRLAAFNDTYLNACILSHSKCRAALRSAHGLTEAIALFNMYQEILASQFLNISPPPNSYLHQYVSFRLLLRPYLHEQILALLKGAEGRLSLLSNYLENPFSTFQDLWDSLSSSSNIAFLRNCWTLFEEAEKKLNIHKSQQLKLAADLLEKHPGKLYLKEPMDPSQGPPRQNTTHIVNRFRGDAEKILRDGVLVGRFSTNWIFRMDNIPLVPYDRYLALFLETIKKHPPPPPLRSIGGSTVSRPSLGNIGSNDKNRVVMNYYPEKIAADMNTVMNGLEYIHTSPIHSNHQPELQPRERTNIHFNHLGGGTERFAYKHPPRFLTATRNYYDIKFYGLGPHDDREYEWLQAFMRVVTWMGDGNTE